MTSAPPAPISPAREFPLGTARTTAALLALALGGFAIGTTEFVTMGLLPDIAAGVRVSIPSAGHAISAYALGVVVGAPTIAALAARLPRRALLVALMASFAAGNAFTALAPGYASLLAARFVAGLPHGAYFGVASLVAASLVPPRLRGRAVSSVMLGLAVATVVGVPAATWLGQGLGWRTSYWAVLGLAVLTMAAVLAVVPPSPAQPGAGVRTELAALRRPQVILTVGVGVVGFGGMFAFYSYIAPLATQVAGIARGTLPLVLLVYGIGSVLGTALAGRLADLALFPALVGGIVASGVVLAAVAVLATTPAGLMVAALFVSMSASVLAVCLQLRLMEVAGDAQMLGAALNHSALNVANALGAWIGGVVIDAGLGYVAPSLAGALLAGGGLVVLTVSGLLRRREMRRFAERPPAEVPAAA